MPNSNKYLSKCLRLAEIKYKHAHPLIADAMSRIGMIYHLNDNNLTEAEKYLHRSFEIRKMLYENFICPKMAHSYL